MGGLLAELSLSLAAHVDLLLRPGDYDDRAGCGDAVTTFGKDSDAPQGCEIWNRFCKFKPGVASHSPAIV